MTDKTVIFTDGGAVSKRGKWYGGWGFAGKSDSGATFVGYGACNHGRATNNVAELDGYLNAAKYVVKNNLKSVTFTLDSKYVLNGATKFLSKWENNNWLTSTGAPLVNKDKWLEVKAVRKAMDDGKISHNYAWVKGHSGVEGNEEADKGATKGIKLAFQSDYEPVIFEETDESAVEIKKVKQTFTKLFCLKRLLMVTNMPVQQRVESGHYIYYQTSYDDKNSVRAKYLGRPGTDVIESVVLTKDKVEPVDDILTTLDSGFKGVNKPAVIQWDKVATKKNFGTLVVKGKDCLVVDDKDVYLNGDELLAYVIGSPRMAFHAYRSLDDKYLLLNSYLDGKIKDDFIMDVTHLFLEEGKKGKQKLLPGLSGLPTFKVRMEPNGKPAEFLLMPNANMPQVTRLSSLATSHGGLTIKAIIHAAGTKTYRHSIIIETGDGDIAIYDNPHTNLRMYSKK